MKKKIKMLKSLITKIENAKVRPTDPYMSGVNSGMSNTIRIIEEKISTIEAAEDY